MTLANRITIARIITIPLFMIALFEQHLLLAQIIFGFSILTDAIDGFMARRRKERTALGTFLDPLADKLLLLASYISFTALHWIPVWVLIVVISKDLFVILGWGLIYLLTGNSKIEPRPLGKTTTALEMVFAMLIVFQFPSWLSFAFLYAMIAVCVLALGDYLFIANKRLEQST